MKRFFPDLRERSKASELMDSPSGEERRLRNTLRQLSLINLLFTRSRALLKRSLLADMRRAPQRAYTLLDLGAGGCDLPVWLARVCRRRGLRLRITALELDSRAVAYAREKCRNFPEIEITQGSALALDGFPACDYIFSNHLLHHLTDAQIPPLLDLVARKARRGFLLNDLRRSAWAYWGFTLTTGWWAHDSFAFYDGRLSILKGFTPGEMNALLARCAAREQIRLSTVFPARMVLTRTSASPV
jgi:2-polyprenyl-3-methyl-5-hydroxy-6-metoxy-1,4-benzoquinol methylase